MVRVTIYGLHQAQLSSGVSAVVLADVDLERVVGAAAVVVVELQTLLPSFRIQNAALQLSRVAIVGCAGAEVHEIP